MKDHEPIDEMETSSSSQRDRVRLRKKHRSSVDDLGDSDPGPQVIARIPRLEKHRETIGTARPKRSREQRLLGSRFSAWTIVGGVGFLIVAAFLSSLVSRTFQSKDLTSRESSQRPEVPAPDAPPAPRWAATPPSSERESASTSNFKALDPPSFKAPTTGLSIATSGQNQVGQSAVAPAAAPATNVPWQPVPGARSPEVLPGGALGSLPANPPGVSAPGSGRINYDDERFPPRGGLVNAKSPGPRDVQADPRFANRYGAAPDNRQDFRQDFRGPAPAEISQDYRSGLAGEPRPDYRPAPFDSRSDYRVAERTRYPDANNPRNDELRRDPPDYRRYQELPNGISRGQDAATYPSREQTVGYESGVSPAGRPPAASRPGSSSSTGPEWVSPPNWVTPPAWDSPIASNPGRSPQTPGTGTPSYPTTGYPGPESWAIGNGAVSGQGLPPSTDYAPARFEGGIERPSNRMSYEHTGSSIR
jgi:hypothetical protein